MQLPISIVREGSSALPSRLMVGAVRKARNGEIYYKIFIIKYNLEKVKYFFFVII